jgi:hypothetical protein
MPARMARDAGEFDGKISPNADIRIVAEGLFW